MNHPREDKAEALRTEGGSTMREKLLLGALLPALALVALAGLPATDEGLKVISDKTATGFTFPESVAYDAAAGVLYVSEFGSALKPTEKDGPARITKDRKSVVSGKER